MTSDERLLGTTHAAILPRTSISAAGEMMSISAAWFNRSCSKTVEIAIIIEYSHREESHNLEKENLSNQNARYIADVFTNCPSYFFRMVWSCRLYLWAMRGGSRMSGACFVCTLFVAGLLPILPTNSHTTYSSHWGKLGSYGRAQRALFGFSLLSDSSPWLPTLWDGSWRSRRLWQAQRHLHDDAALQERI